MTEDPDVPVHVPARVMANYSFALRLLPLGLLYVKNKKLCHDITFFGKLMSKCLTVSWELSNVKTIRVDGERVVIHLWDGVILTVFMDQTKVKSFSDQLAEYAEAANQKAGVS